MENPYDWAWLCVVKKRHKFIESTDTLYLKINALTFLQRMYINLIRNGQ